MVIKRNPRLDDVQTSKRTKSKEEKEMNEKLATKEASPVSLIRERTESFYNKKVIMLSTPTGSRCNLRMGHVPCPYCGVLQPLKWRKKDE